MEVSKKSRRTIFVVLLCACMVASMVQTALSTALPPIMEEMGLAMSTVQWLNSSYSLVMGTMILATAWLIKRFPARPLFLIFQSIFTVGLLVSALAGSFVPLLLGRILQAVGCGLLMSLTQVIILTIYPANERGSIMGIYGLAVSGAPVLAPTLAGIIIDLAGWRAIFWICLVLSIAILAGGVYAVKNTTETEPSKLDLLSFLLCAVGFFGITNGLGNTASAPLLSLSVGGSLALGGIALILFALRQNKLETPFIQLAIFRNYEFRTAVIASMILYCGMMAVSTLLPVYVQSIRGFKATVSGLVTLPGSLATALVSPVAGKLYDKLGIQKLYIIGSLFIVVGHFSMFLMGESTPLILVGAFFVIRQIGTGALMMTTVTWGMSRLEAKYTSDGTALISSLRTIAGAVGAALFSAIMTAAAKGSEPAGMIVGTRTAFLGITAVSALLLLIAFGIIRHERQIVKAQGTDG